MFAFGAQMPPLGLLYLASMLERQGHHVEVIDFCAEQFTKERLTKALTTTDVVGITVRSHGIRSVSVISTLIKEAKPDMPVIVGGPHCTLQPQQALIETNADVCVGGDGENAIVQILDALDGKIKLATVPGVYYKENNVVKHGSPAEFIGDLDSIPFPARYLVEHYCYGHMEGGLNFTRGKVTSLITSRGCQFNCRFCIAKAITKKYRTRSVENVIAELKEIKQNYDFLHIIDDNFFVNKKMADRILDFLIEDQCDLELWISGIRTDVGDKDLFKKMQRAGVTIINIGIESGNQDVLDFYHKEITLGQIQHAVQLARRAGFLTIGYFILGAPIETRQHLENTINFAKKLPLDQAVFSPLAYLKGSPLWKEAVADGKIRKDECIVASDSTRGLGNFSTEELWEWCIKAYREFYLRPRYIFDQVTQSFIRRNFHLLKEGLKLLLRDDNVLTYDFQES